MNSPPSPIKGSRDTTVRRSETDDMTVSICDFFSCFNPGSLARFLLRNCSRVRFFSNNLLVN